MKITFDHIKTVLSMLVIPLVIWGVKLEVNNAVMAQSIVRLEVDMQKTSETERLVQQNSVALAQLKERIDAANEILKDIKDILRERAFSGGN